MFRNYSITAWRSLVRDKAYSFINIFGLALGLSVAMLIGAWVYDEISFNRSFKHYDRIVQLYHHINFGGDIFTMNEVPAPIGEAMRNSCPEFESVVMTGWIHDYIVDYRENKVSKKGLYVEPGFLDIFSIEVLQGARHPLQDNHSIMLSQRTAEEFFGRNAIGQTIRIGGKHMFTISAIYRDFPSNSNFADVEMLMPLAYHFTTGPEEQKQQNSWEGYLFQCYALLQPEADLNAANATAEKILYKNASNDGKALDPKGFWFEMNDWHLQGDFEGGVSTGKNATIITRFSVVGILVLVLACINFINLSTARAHTRMKEVGVRKVLGSLRRQIASQFLCESFFLVVFAYGVAVVLSILVLPWFNTLTQRPMSLPWSQWHFLIWSFVLIVLTSFLAGAYPSLYLASFKPISVLKKRVASRGNSWQRKASVVFQFVVSTILIISAAVVYKQIEYAKDRPRVFDLEGIIHLPIKTEQLSKVNYSSLRHELISSGVVENMAISDFPITGNMSGDGSFEWEGKDPSSAPLIALNSCSHDFPKTNGFEFTRGRDFSPDIASDSNAVIINEMAVKIIADKDPIGKKITFRDKERTIVGVITDQLRWSPFQKQSAHIYYIDYKAMNDITIRLKKDVVVADALERIQGVIKNFDPDAPFEYEFLDDDWARQFAEEERVGRLAVTFCGLAILISSMGMFGMAAFTVSRRTKEIAIRKTLGATVLSVWKTLSRDFVTLVMFSVVIAIPLAYFFASNWLEQYEYRIDVPWVIFLLAGALTASITLITISLQTVRAALQNPVDNLKAE